MVTIRVAVASALLLLVTTGGALAQSQVSGNAFNPAISLILNGRYNHYSADPATFAPGGFALGEEAGLAEEGLSLDETELAISANIDDKFYGAVTLAVAQADGTADVALEEAFIETLALPHGLKLRAGRFLSDIGYLNPVHSHAWDFADAPLSYTAMLDTALGDTGVQLRWVAPTILFVEVGGELLRGDSFPAAGARNGGTGAATLFAHVGGDVGTSNSWRAGLSRLVADASDRRSDIGDGELGFTGDSNLWIADFVWKWARNGNPRDRSFVVQAEYLNRDESGDVTVDPLSGTGDAGLYDGEQTGFYVQGVYQFRPRWRVGLRYDRLTADNTTTLTLPTPLLTDGSPRRVSVMTDFSNSEFSRLRLQFNRDESGPATDNQLFLQYLMSLGAHGAHRF
jgi:hypothetical protein